MHNDTQPLTREECDRLAAFIEGTPVVTHEDWLSKCRVATWKDLEPAGDDIEAWREIAVLPIGKLFQKARSDEATNVIDHGGSHRTGIGFYDDYED